MENYEPIKLAKGFSAEYPGVLVVDDRSLNLTALVGIVSIFDLHCHQAISG